LDRRVSDLYARGVEARRLFLPGVGDLIRLRTWDIFERYLPPGGAVIDVGSGPGVHAAHLAERGDRVTLVEPVRRHLDEARALTPLLPDGAALAVVGGDARDLPLRDECADAVLLMGPLYHLVDSAERARALGESHRVLKRGGLLFAEVITRHAWLINASDKGVLNDEIAWAAIEENLRSGLSVAPERLPPGGFWAYFHTLDELEAEVESASFVGQRPVAVESYGWILGSLDVRMRHPEALLRALRMVEEERTLLGVSGHVICIAVKP
jgi:SAM-dependent methyltransferase